MGVIYRAFGLFPDKTTLDMLTEQTFYATAQSPISDYQVRIYRLIDNTLLYDSTKINLVTPLYATQTLFITIPITGALATERELKWTLQAWNGADSALSREFPFTNYESPTISISVPPTINEQSYQFVGLYSHNQGIGVARYKYTLYTDAQEIIEETDWIQNTSLVQTFDSFVDNTSYYVRCEIYDTNDVYADTNLVMFTVDYSEPSLTVIPKITNIFNSASMLIKWVGAYVLEGLLSGTATFIDNFLYLSNKGISIDSNSYAYWENVNIEDTRTTSVLWQPQNGATFEGLILEHLNTTTNEYISVGYSQTASAFYKQNQEGITYGSPIVIDENNSYLIKLVGTALTIQEFN